MKHIYEKLLAMEHQLLGLRPFAETLSLDQVYARLLVLEGTGHSPPSRSAPSSQQFRETLDTSPAPKDYASGKDFSDYEDEDYQDDTLVVEMGSPSRSPGELQPEKVSWAELLVSTPPLHNPTSRPVGLAGVGELAFFW